MHPSFRVAIAMPFLAACAAVVTPCAKAGLITLETPALGAALHDEDWRPAAGFTSGGALFNNSFFDFGTFTSWAGFALSRETNTTTPGFGNQFSAFAGSGASGSLQYAVGYVDPFNNVFPTIDLPAGESALSISVTNTTYAGLSMRDGDSFAKKFGGATGNDPDFFKLTISGLDAANSVLGSVQFYLADYRFANNASDYILNAWTSVDLSTLPAATRKLRFALDSSDGGSGASMNTPSYFAVDNLSTVPEPASALLLAGAAAGLLIRRKRA
jgi:hypothetical protein